MQPSHHPPTPRAPVTPLARPQAGRAHIAAWPFYVQAPRLPCFEMEVNARRVLETSARYFAVPLTPEPAIAAAAKRGSTVARR